MLPCMQAEEALSKLDTSEAQSAYMELNVSSICWNLPHDIVHLPTCSTCAGVVQV